MLDIHSESHYQSLQFILISLEVLTRLTREKECATSGNLAHHKKVEVRLISNRT